jgi:integration host factor subunit alpha
VYAALYFLSKCFYDKKNWLVCQLKVSHWIPIVMAKTLTRADLTESVYRNIGLSRNESSDLVESVLEEICTCLEAGEEVKLSSFGTFSVQSKRQRVGRNPKTGVEAVITPRRVLSFRPSHILKDRVDNA